MAEQNIAELREQLIERKEKLNISIKQAGDNENLINLLEQVDAALERMDNGTYGICVICQGHIEPERLKVDPLATVCLEDLNSEEQRILEQDLNLAAKIQHGLLPKNDLVSSGWITSYSYIPAGLVSGDYCDIIEFKDGTESLLFLLGDVSGKGVAASLLMSHMRAMFRSLIDFDLRINSLVEKANRLFCESSILSNFATLVCGKANSLGEIEICSAGHNPPLLIKDNEVIKIDATGVPIGLFCNAKYESKCLNIDKDDILFLYSDGLTESTSNDIEYGEERLIKTVSSLKSSSPKNMISGVLEDLNSFLSGSQRKDDITIMALKRNN
jgi:phosphoserine phosphatase RsbU/P